MDRLECDRMFVAVFETGAFSRGAERLGTSAGQASKLIAKLESALGAQLLKRTTRALAPTEVGRAYYARVKGLIEDFDALDASVRNASGKVGGRLALTVPMSFGATELAPALIAFAEAFPEVALDVTFSDRVANLVDEGFDVAVRIGEPRDSTLIARMLCPMRVVVAASPDYLKAHGEPAEPRALAGHACILDTNFRDPGVWRFRDLGGEAMTVPVNGRLRFSSAEACLAAAEAGLGVTCVPTFIAGPRLRNGALRPLLRAFAPPPAGVYVMSPPGRHLAQKVRALSDFLAKRFRGEPAWDKGW